MSPFAQPSARPHENNSTSTGRIFLMPFDNFFKHLSRIFKFYYDLTRITGISQEVLRKFMITSHRILLRTEMIKQESLYRKSKHIKCCKFFFFENLSVCDVQKRATAGQTTDDNVTRRMLFAC
jgi:hypothetical protein